MYLRQVLAPSPFRHIPGLRTPAKIKIQVLGLGVFGRLAAWVLPLTKVALPVSLRVLLHIHIHIRACARTHTCAHSCTHACTRTRTHSSMHANAHTCTRSCKTRMRMRVCARTCTYARAHPEALSRRRCPLQPRVHLPMLTS